MRLHRATTFIMGQWSLEPCHCVDIATQRAVLIQVICTMQDGAAAVPQHCQGHIVMCCRHRSRAMGDTYARDEFRRHWKPQTTKSQWQAFVQEWQRYLSMLQGHADLPEQSGDIPENVLDSLNEEQKAQLARLKEEAVKAREAILSGKPSEG